MACLIDVKHHNSFTTDAKRGTLKTIGIDSCDLLASRPATVTGALRNCSLHNLESLINQNPFGMCGPLAGGRNGIGLTVERFASQTEWQFQMPPHCHLVRSLVPSGGEAQEVIRRRSVPRGTVG